MGSIVKRAANSYTVIYYETGPDGKRKQKWLAVPGTKKNAQAVLARIEHEINAGTFVSPERVSVLDFGARWLKDYGRDNLAPSTFEDYANTLRLYVYPHLGRRDLATIRTMDVQSLYTQLREHGGRGGRELSPVTVQYVHKVLRRMFAHAVQWQVLQRSPIESATPPRGKSERPAILESTEAVESLLDTARGTWLYLPVLLAVSLTLRRGEALALRWRHVNLTTREVHVCEQLRQTRANGIQVAAPKTAAGTRHIPMPGFLVDDLRSHRTAVAELLLSRGEAWDEDRLINSKKNGDPFCPEGLSHAFGKLADQAECPQITYHSLRHTSISFLLKRGVPPHVVSKIAGHASVHVTLSLYAHVLKEMEQTAIAEMDGFLPQRKTGEHKAQESAR